MSINMKASISASYLDKGAWFKPVEESEEHKNAKATQEKFSEVLDRMKKGQGTVSDDSSSGADSEGQEDTVTVTRLMSDSSTMITVMRKGKIISQTKTHGAVKQENPKLLDTTTTVEHGGQAEALAGAVNASTIGGAGIGAFMAGNAES